MPLKSTKAKLMRVWASFIYLIVKEYKMKTASRDSMSISNTLDIKTLAKRNFDLIRKKTLQSWTVLIFRLSICLTFAEPYTREYFV